MRAPVGSDLDGDSSGLAQLAQQLRFDLAILAVALYRLPDVHVVGVVQDVSFAREHAPVEPALRQDIGLGHLRSCRRIIYAGPRPGILAATGGTARFLSGNMLAK